MISKLKQRFSDALDSIRILTSVKRGLPVAFTYQGRDYFINPDNSAHYHIKNSTMKIANMVKLLDPEAQVIFDVGANCGLFASFASTACPEASIHCFEPSHSLIPFIHMNCNSSKIHIHELGVGDTNGSQEIFINPRSQQTNSFNHEAVALFAKDDEIEKRIVDCVTIDEFVKTKDINRIDILKVDVQGHEGAVFRGATNNLSNVQILFVESTWMDIESIVELIPFSMDYGFTHAAVINPVYMGADVMLSRRKITHPEIMLNFKLDKNLLSRRWV